MKNWKSCDLAVLKEMTGYLRRIWRRLVSRSTDYKNQETPQYHLPELIFSSPLLLPAKKSDYFLPELKFSSFDSLLFERCLEEGKAEKHERTESLTHPENTTFDLDLVSVLQLLWDKLWCLLSLR